MNGCVIGSIIVFAIFVGIALLSVLLPLLFIGNRKLIKCPEYIAEVLHERMDYIVEKRNFFLRNSISWMMGFYALSVLSACSTVLVLFLCAYAKESDRAIFVFSAISLCMTIFIMAVNPQSHYVKFRRAFRILDDVINSLENEFTSEQNNNNVIRINSIIEDAISKSENMMDE